uniref:Uncharacterized protein n=1 Tax=Mustela putorius furo TaxID=9669 RepID=M3Y9P3_MUSPF
MGEKERTGEHGGKVSARPPVRPCAGPPAPVWAVGGPGGKSLEEQRPLGRLETGPLGAGLSGLCTSLCLPGGRRSPPCSRWGGGWGGVGGGGAGALGAGPLLSHVPMSMLCFIGGGGRAAPITGPLFAFIFGCGFAGLLAMAAHEVGFETGIFTFVPPLPERTPVTATLLTTDPTVLTAEVVTSPIFRPTMPCSRLFIPGALLRVSP